MDTIVGCRMFPDGWARDIYADARGQYVIADDGDKVYRDWLPLDEEPDEMVVDCRLDSRKAAGTYGATAN